MAWLRPPVLKLAYVDLALLGALGSGLGCSSHLESQGTMDSSRLEPAVTAPSASERAPVAPQGSSPGDAPSGMLIDPESAPADRGDVVEDVCVAQAAASELRRIYMAVAFDVSGSMGQLMDGDDTRFRQKWQPVVAATKSFFAEQEAAGISASLTFFPSGATRQAECNRNTYLTPDVPQTLLPSTVFGDAIDALGRTPSGNWPQSTPTLAAYESTVASLRALQQNAPQANATYVIVMVTDGVPQNCGDNATHFANVLSAVGNAGIPTYVIGVELEQNSASNLNQLAAAGGTGSAFIIQTGDPVQTERDFKAAIDDIRGVSVSCQVEIPVPPANTEFVPEQVNVTYKGAGDKLVRLTYDAECKAPESWRYDDPKAPASILLCDNACGTIKADVEAKLEIEFGCKRRDVPR